MPKTAPRGLKPWLPSYKSQILLDQMLTVLREYEAQGQLTLRQIFYRLVATERIEKTESAYNRVLRIGNLGRRSGKIPFSAIRDDGVRSYSASFGGGDTASAHAKLKGMGWKAKHTFVSSMSFRQPINVRVMCEANGMARMLSNAVSNLGVTVHTSGGFDSVTAKYNLTKSLLRERRPIKVLHFGDRDPSGVHLFTSLRDDVLEMIDDLVGTLDYDCSNEIHRKPDIEFIRLAVTQAQIEEYGFTNFSTQEVRQSIIFGSFSTM